MATTDIWTYREQTWSTTDFTGYSVEATDGGIGKVDEATNEVGGSYIVVDTGPWIFGKKTMLPAGVIERIDPESETIFVNVPRTRSRTRPSSTMTATPTRRTGPSSAATTVAARSA